MLTLETFPLVRYFSIPTSSLVVTGNFLTQTKTARAYLDGTPAIHDFFDQVAARIQHSAEGTNRHFLVDRYLWRKLHEDQEFRGFHMVNFLEDQFAPGMGTLLYGDGGQLGYLYMSEEDTLRIKHRQGRYLAVIALVQNTFTGFEEAIIANERIAYLTGGVFTAPFITPFILQITGAFLAYLAELDQVKLVGKERNQTGQPVYHVI